MLLSDSDYAFSKTSRDLCKTLWLILFISVKRALLYLRIVNLPNSKFIIRSVIGNDQQFEAVMQISWRSTIYKEGAFKYFFF